MAKRPTSAVGNRRPTSEFARVAAAVGGNPRYKVNLVSSIMNVLFFSKQRARNLYVLFKIMKIKSKLIVARYKILDYS